MYKQVHPRANLSIECNTSRVPSNGKYYVLKDGKVIATFRTLKAARQCYQKLVDELALPSLLEQETKGAYEHMMDDYFTYTSNNTLLGTNFGRKWDKKTGRFTKTK